MATRGEVETRRICVQQLQADGAHGIRRHGLRRHGLRRLGLRNLGLRNLGLRNPGLRNLGLGRHTRPPRTPAAEAEWHAGDTLYPLLPDQLPRCPCLLTFHRYLLDITIQCSKCSKQASNFGTLHTRTETPKHALVQHIANCSDMDMSHTSAACRIASESIDVWRRSCKPSCGFAFARLRQPGHTHARRVYAPSSLVRCMYIKQHSRPAHALIATAKIANGRICSASIASLWENRVVLCI